MQRASLLGTIVVALTFGIGVAAAAEVNLTQQQREMIQQNLSTEPGQPMPSGFRATVGQKVPGSVSLKQLPSNLKNQISSLKNEEYAKFNNNEIVLVNPSGRDVVATIQGASTTGQQRR
jgi:hypothetical protein